MRKNVLFTVLLLSLMGLQEKVQAQYFSAISPSGHTLYYEVINETNHWVEVTNPNHSYRWDSWTNYSTPYGNVIVPPTVNWNGIDWTVRHIGHDAFFDCQTIQGLTLPEGIDSIKEYALYNINIDTLVIPSTVTFIGQGLFNCPRMHYLTIPASVQQIAHEWGEGGSILGINVAEGNPYYRSIDGCLVRQTNDIVELMVFPRARFQNVDSVVIPEGVTKIDFPVQEGIYKHKLIVPSTMTYLRLSNDNENGYAYDTIVFHGMMPPALIDNNGTIGYVQRFELPCGARRSYSVTAWGQYADRFFTNNYLTQREYSHTIAYGESYPWGDNTLTERGVYEDTLLSVVEGCDSLHRVLTLNVVQHYRDDITLNAQLPAYNYHGLTVDHPGIYEVTVSGEGDFDSLFILRASAEVNSTVATVALGGIFDGQSFNLPAMENRQLVRGVDTITVTNIHQIYYDTVDVTIAEGSSYYGHTLAGVYQDTIYAADYDSIVRTRISMTVNRPLDNSLVDMMVGDDELWIDLDSYTLLESNTLDVAPDATRRLGMLQTTGTNLIANGDFEQGNTGFSTTYIWRESKDNLHSGTYGIGAACIPFENDNHYAYFFYHRGDTGYYYGVNATVEPHTWYLLSYKGIGVDGGWESPTRNSTRLYCNGNVMADDKFVYRDEDNNEAVFSNDKTILHLLYSGEASEMELTMWQEAGEDAFMFGIDDVVLTPIAVVDTITIANLHGMVRDTINITIAEGENYRGHTLAGVYQDTVLGTDADSIIRSRISMTVNRPMDSCTVQLGGNQGGTYFAGDEFYTAGTEISVEPSKSKTLQYTPDVLGENLLPFYSMEENDCFSNYQSQYIGDYLTAPNAGVEIWGDRGVDNSPCMMFGYSTAPDQAFFRTSLSTKVGEKYNLSFMASSSHNDIAIFVLKVNGILTTQTDTLVCCNQAGLRYFEHIIEATSDVTTIELINVQMEPGPYGIGWYIDNMSLTKVYSPTEDTITITNTHGMVYDTVDVSISEGESYHGHTLAGVYQDTILGADADSIVRSRVSMTVNRPLDNCLIPLGSNITGSWYIDGSFVANSDNITLQVAPSENRQLVFYPGAYGTNLIVNGDFENSNIESFITDYATPDSPGSPYRTYSHQGGVGVDGGNGVYFDGSTIADQSVISVTSATVPGFGYSFSYMARSACGDNPSYFQVKMNGVPQERTDVIPLNGSVWSTFTYDFIATTNATTIDIVDLCLQGNGNDFYLDNISLVQTTANFSDTITITNTHGMVYDTVDVTIAEGQSYRGHTLAGVYQDTILGAETDSIVYARVSMDVNYSFGNGMVGVGTNQEGHLWRGVNDEVQTLEPGFSVQLQPQEERRYVLTSVADGSNMQPNGDFEQWQNNWSCDYAWGSVPFQGGHYIFLCDTCGRTGIGIAATGSGLENRYVYTSEWMNLVEGHRYSFSYWAKSHSGNPAQLAIDVYDQQRTYRIADTADLGEAMDEWKRYEHVFTAWRTYASLVRITDLNTSSNGNEFFLDDVSLIDLTEATDARRDTITLRNIHQLHYATIDTTIEEGEIYNGHTTAGVYNDTMLLSDYDSVIHSRVSYLINTTGEGAASLAANTDGLWFDLDNNRVYSDSMVNLYPMQTRTFGLLVPTSDTNLIVNGDFEQGNTGFTSHFLYRPEPYDLGDGTYYIGGYRINTMLDNHYIYAFNYWEPRQGALYETTANVLPNTWYRLTYRGVSDALRGDVTTHPYGNDNTVKVNGQLIGVDLLTYSGSTNISEAEKFTHFIYNESDTVISIELNTSYGETYYFAYDDITLTPLTVVDTITVTNRHQIVHATVDTTINEGEIYNGYTTAGVYVDTLFLTDYDSITTSRVSMVINSLNGEVQLASNQLGWWKDTNNIVLAQSSIFTTQVPPMQTRQYVFDGQMAIGNMLVNGNFEQGMVGFTSQYNYSDGCRSCGPNNYAVIDGFGVNGGNCLSFDGSESYGTVLYEQTIEAIIGATYSFNYLASTNGQDNSNPAYFEVLVNGVAIGSWDYITTTYPEWNTFEHTFVANNGTLTLQIIDRNTESSGNDCLIDELELVVIGGASIITDTITITNRHQLVYDTTRADICQGGVYTVDSIDYANAGTYTLNTLYYIDSTVYPTLILDVHNNYYPQLTQAICEGESYAFDGDTLTATGTYVDPHTTIWGCDSTTTLNLTVHAHTASRQTENVCDNYMWHGTVYTASTIVIDTIDNVHGCDSVCTLNLTVRYSTTGDTAATACDYFNWYNQTYTASGTPTHTLTNAVGCDSTLTLALTVNYSTTGSETYTVCDSLTWHDALYTVSGTYQDMLTNIVGCDSIVTLYLTVNSTYQHTDAVFACDNQLPYMYHEQPLNTAGDHAVHFQSVAGCDSTVTVTLTVGATYQHSDQLALCQSGMPYTYGDRTFLEDDTTGVYTIPFSSVEGCDSIISLDLTVHESEATEIYVVTVQATNNLVLWQPAAAVESYRIYRESSTSGIYSLMAEVPYDEGGSWLDTESDARQHSYRYRMTSVDSCGVESEQSPIHRTMHLTINQGVGNSWNLVWTEYQGTTYSTYRIFRGTSYDNMQMIGEIPSDNTTFTDNNAPEGYVYYQIVVLLSAPGAKDASNEIRSNVATNDQTGIGSVAEGYLNVYQQNGDIVVETVQGQPLQVYDLSGRKLFDVISTGVDRFEVPVTGVYLIRVEGMKTHRIVVEK